MEARFADVAAGAGQVLLSPALLAGFTVGIVAVLSGLAGRVAVVVEDLGMRPSRGVPVLPAPTRVAPERGMADVVIRLPSVVAVEASQDAAVVVLSEYGSVEEVLDWIGSQGARFESPRRIEFRRSPVASR